MKDKKISHTILIGSSFVLGVFLLAFCYNWVLLPLNFVVSGTSGIAIVLEDWFGINPTIFIYLTSFILLIVSFICLGYEKTKNTIVGSILYPLMISFTLPIAKYLNANYPVDDIYLIIIFAIILLGISNGLIYKCGFTTGGSDVLMQLMNKYFKISEGKATTAVNIVVIVCGGITFGYINAIYSLIILIVSSLIVDKIMFGISDSKLFYVFTRKERKVKKIILEELQSGYTILPTRGGYSHIRGSLILCVVPNRDYYLFKERILQVDPTAFFIIEDCYEVNGGVKRPNNRFFKF